MMMKGKEYNDKNKDKINEHNKEYYEKNKDKILKKVKEYYENHKNKINKYKKKYYQKNKDKLSKKEKEYYEKNKNRISKRSKKYREKNKENLSIKHKEYYEKNKDNIRKKNKNLYYKAINRICNHYNIKTAYCFFCGKKQAIENGKTTIYIDHKAEKLTEEKDELNNTKLYKHICGCKEDEVNNYQLLCMKCNLMKEHIYEMIIQFKNKNDIVKYNKLLNIYNHTLIINKLNDDEKQNK